MGLDSAEFAQQLERLDAIDRSGGAGDRDDDAWLAHFNQLRRSAGRWAMSHRLAASRTSSGGSAQALPSARSLAFAVASKPTLVTSPPSSIGSDRAALAFGIIIRSRGSFMRLVRAQSTATASHGSMSSSTTVTRLTMLTDANTASITRRAW